MYVERKENTSSHALSPLTTMFGRNLVIETGIGSSSFSASKDASLVIRYGAKSPNDALEDKEENKFKTDVIHPHFIRFSDASNSYVKKLRINLQPACKENSDR